MVFAKDKFTPSRGGHMPNGFLFFFFSIQGTLCAHFQTKHMKTVDKFKFGLMLKIKEMLS